MTDYQEYLQSPEWNKRKGWVLIFWGSRCAVCCSNQKVQVHHRNYDRVGKELLTDLIVLCDTCHALFHKAIGVNH